MQESKYFRVLTKFYKDNHLTYISQHMFQANINIYEMF